MGADLVFNAVFALILFFLLIPLVSIVARP